MNHVESLHLRIRLLRAGRQAVPRMPDGEFPSR